MRLSERAQFLVDNLDLVAASGVPDARWEFFQLALLSDDGLFRIDNKSRQIAWSWSAAADAVASAILDKRDSIFVSINQREAQEKIRYSIAILESIRLRGLPAIKRSNRQEIELSTGVRLTSLPAQKPRGRPRSNVYFDEFAHVRGAAAIYQGATPIISKGGRIRIGSSPFGASDTFWEIWSEAIQPYPDYNRRQTPWWETYAFCTNPKEARRLAPAMPTWDRVGIYGKERLQAIYRNIPLEDFQQEYECLFLDASTAWITWDEIRRAQDADLLCEQAEARPGNIQGALDAIRQLARNIDAGKVERWLAGGVDVGRTRNTTELYAVGWGTSEIYPLRLAISMDGMAFDDQERIIGEALERLPFVKMHIDRNGLGMSLAEHMEQAHPSTAEGVDFTNASKTKWATDAKILIQGNRTPLPVDKDLAYQIHSIKRRVSAGRNLVFDTDTAEKHHADRFWAWALALASTQGDRLEQAGANILGAWS